MPEKMTITFSSDNPDEIVLIMVAWELIVNEFSEKTVFSDAVYDHYGALMDTLRNYIPYVLEEAQNTKRDVAFLEYLAERLT